MKIDKVGHGYYSVDRLKSRREHQEDKLARLDKLIDRATHLAQKRVKDKYSKYTKRDLKIHKLRKKGLTLDQIGAKFKITKNRVCQILNHGNGNAKNN